MIRKITLSIIFFFFALTFSSMPLNATKEDEYEKVDAEIIDIGFGADITPEQEVNAAKYILNRLAKKKLIRYTESDTNKHEDLLGNQELLKLKEGPFDPARASLIIALRDALEYGVLPEFAGIKKYISAEKNSWVPSAAIIGASLATFSITLGMLTLYALLPTGLSLGLMTDPACMEDGSIVSANDICINGTGYAVQGSYNGGFFYCPTNFSKLAQSSYSEVCLDDGAIADLGHVKQFSESVVDLTLGSMGLAGAFFSCTSVFFAAGTYLLASCKRLSVAGCAELHMKEQLAQIKLEEFSFIQLALDLLIEESISKRD